MIRGQSRRRIGASDAWRAEAKRISERAEALEGRGERPVGLPPDHPRTAHLGSASHENRVTRAVNCPRRPAVLPLRELRAKLCK